MWQKALLFSILILTSPITLLGAESNSPQFLYISQLNIDSVNSGIFLRQKLHEILAEISTPLTIKENNDPLLQRINDEIPKSRIFLVAYSSPTLNKFTVPFLAELTAAYKSKRPLILVDHRQDAKPIDRDLLLKSKLTAEDWKALANLGYKNKDDVVAAIHWLIKHEAQKQFLYAETPAFKDTVLSILETAEASAPLLSSSSKVKDPKKKQRPIRKGQYEISEILKRFDKTPEDAHLLVCEGRKVVYVIDPGVIDSKDCFHKEKPTPSIRANTGKGMIPSEWEVILIPNNWTSLVIVELKPWIAQTRYVGKKLEFRFIPVFEENEINLDTVDIASAPWRDNAGAAFKLAFQNARLDEEATDPSAEKKREGRHNGFLYAGVGYERPQQYLRDLFREDFRHGKYASTPKELKDMLIAWAGPESNPVDAQPSASTSAAAPRKSMVGTSQAKPKADGRLSLEELSEPDYEHIPVFEAAEFDDIRDICFRKISATPPTPQIDYFFRALTNPRDENYYFRMTELWAFIWTYNMDYYFLGDGKKRVHFISLNTLLELTSQLSDFIIVGGAEDETFKEVAKQHTAKKLRQAVFQRYKMADVIQFLQLVENTAEEWYSERPQWKIEDESKEDDIVKADIIRARNFVLKAIEAHHLDKYLAKVPSLNLDEESQKKIFVRLVTHLPDGKGLEQFWEDHVEGKIGHAWTPGNREIITQWWEQNIFHTKQKLLWRKSPAEIQEDRKRLWEAQDQKRRKREKLDTAPEPQAPSDGNFLDLLATAAALQDEEEEE